MTERGAPILVLGLGNDILGDDAVGLLAARRLRASPVQGVDVVETGEAGLALLDLLEGYDRALLLDSIVAGDHPPGAILEFTSADFAKIVGPSPHYAGLPEVIRLAHALGIAFPGEIRVLACAVADPYQLRDGLSGPVQAAVAGMVERASRIVEGWRSTR